ncbi:unnamed protein product, partial [Brassica oleracea]
MWWDWTMEAGYNCSSACIQTSTGMKTSTYTFNFSDKTHTRSVRLKLMEPSLLSLVASITFKPQRQLLAQIAS